MARFSITISDEVVARHSREAWQCMADFIEAEAPLLVGHQNLTECSWTYKGDASQSVVAVLQAAARGDDLAAVLDLVALHIDGDRRVQ